MLSPGGLHLGVGTLPGQGGGTLGQDFRPSTCPLGLQGERLGPGFSMFQIKRLIFSLVILNELDIIF